MGINQSPFCCTGQSAMDNNHNIACISQEQPNRQGIDRPNQMQELTKTTEQQRRHRVATTSGKAQRKANKYAPQTDSSSALTLSSL